MSDVITLSSDDEADTPMKKIKLCNDISITNHVAVITKVETISSDKEAIKSEIGQEISALTIFIKDKENETTTKSTEDNKAVVITDDEEEASSKLKENCILDKKSEPIEDKDDNPEDDSNSLLVLTKEEKVSNSNDQPSTSKASECHKLLDEYLTACRNSIKGSQYEAPILSKIPKLRKHFNNCDDLSNDQSFIKLLNDNIKTAVFSAADAVVTFQAVYSFILDTERGSCIEVDDEDIRKVKKLEHTCKVLVKKIKHLEELEVDFDDEENSNYMQLDRYITRLDKVHRKFCEVLKMNPHAGRIMHTKIKFSESKYDEINKAIMKSNKHNLFPVYDDVEKCVRKCVAQNSMNLSENEILQETRLCFGKLGEMRQSRRKKQLYDDQCYIVAPGAEDPAKDDTELDVRLKQNFSVAEEKMKTVVEKYVKLQEINVDVKVSEDSDDSNYQDSECEESRLE